MSLDPGSTLGGYEIVSSLGVGGMGEVYRARDAKLGREVAIKTLLDEVAGDAERLARFEREARVLAGLNHPNIATLLGAEEVDGTHFLVMELVEGETLADRIARGPVPVAEAVPMFVRIAEGLEAAHGAGIVHRDLKPANIKVPGGASASSTGVHGAGSMVKILDFGLAKAVGLSGLSADPVSESPTMTYMATMRGELLGTAPYMSPEQARGQDIDVRTDVWAFGACLFEVLTGRRAFEGDTATDSIAAVVAKEPPWEWLPPDLSPRLVELLRRCLAKDPSQRLHHIGDARLELEAPEIATPSVAGSAAAARGGVSKTVAAALAVGGLGVGALLVYLLGVGGGAPDPAARADAVTRFVVAPSTELPLVDTSESDFAVSPDGRQIAYTSGRGPLSRVVLRDLDSLQPRVLAGTEGGLALAYSPDGEWILFFSRTDDRLKKIRVAGADVQTLCESEAVAAAHWQGDEVIFSSRPGPMDGGIFVVSADGGEAEMLAANDGANALMITSPSWLPDGERAMVLAMRPRGQDVMNVEVMDRSGALVKRISTGRGPFTFVDGVGLLYGVEDDLVAQSIDLDTLEFVGPTRTVVDGIRYRIDGHLDYAVSNDGTTLVYVPGGGSGQSATFRWMDREGNNSAALEEEVQQPRYPSLSRDGRFVATSIGPAGQANLWVLDLEERRPSLRLTLGDFHDAVAMWSRDDTRLFFSRIAPSGSQVVSIAADGSALEPEVLLENDNMYLPMALTPDGRDLVLTDINAGNVWILSLETEELQPLLVRDFNDGAALSLSYDGRWLAYTSDRSGVVEVWVQAYPDGAPIQVSSGGGREPRWSRDGKELYFYNGTNLMVASVRGGTERLEFDRPTQLFAASFAALVATIERNYDVSPDGRFLLSQVGSGELAVAEMVVVQNWAAEFAAD